MWWFKGFHLEDAYEHLTGGPFVCVCESVFPEGQVEVGVGRVGLGGQLWLVTTSLL